jgi:serine/threonine protein phosphatase PrpC
MGIGARLRDMLSLVSDTGTPLPLSMSGSVLSDPGRVRRTNEDAVACFLPLPAGRRDALALVADGMGGHAAGEIASHIAAETVGRLYYELDGPVPDVLARSFAAANAAIWQRSQTDPDCAGMGTTCTAIAVRNNRAFLAHVGDSRAYHLRGDRLRQLSQDHSLVGKLVRDGLLSPEEARTSSQRNVILRALGTKPEAEALICHEGFMLQPGDVLVLCSDGLTDLVDDGTISGVAGGRTPEQACKMLVEAALAAGGHDNISVGIVRVGPPDVPPAGARRVAKEDAT